MTLFSLFRRKNVAKKNRLHRRVSSKPQLEVLEDRMVPSSFQDGFEAPTLDPFWSTRTDAGSIALTTAQAHGGSQSVQFSSTYNTGNKDIELYHTYDTPIFGNVSVWVYDTGAGVSSSNYIGLSLTNSGLGLHSNIGTYDYDLGPGQGGDVYYYDAGFVDGTQQALPGPARTLGWHEWEIEATQQSTTLTIDGTSVYSGSGGTQFDRVSLSLSGPTWRPAWVTYFDDFSVTEASPVTVQSVQVNDGSVQRSMVNSLTVTFSTTVNLDPGAFEVRHQGGGLVAADFTSTVVGNQTVAVITFAGAEIIGSSLADGNYTLTVRADHVHDPAGNPLDADNVTSFYRLFGDTQGHRTVDAADVDVMFSAFGKHAGEEGYVAYLDYNGDGAIDDIDLYAFIARYHTTLDP